MRETTDDRRSLLFFSVSRDRRDVVSFFKENVSFTSAVYDKKQASTEAK